MATHPSCPVCGSINATWDGVAYVWLCLQVECLHDWQDEEHRERQAIQIVESETEERWLENLER